MNKSIKIWLITAGLLILAGALIFGGVMTVLGWDFHKLSTDKIVTNEYKINDEFKNISVITNCADIHFLPSEDEKSRMVFHEYENLKHSAEVKEGTLFISLNDDRKWYDHIGFNFSTPEIEVYLPAAEYGDLLINSTTGDISIPDKLSFNSLDISSTTGDIDISSTSANIMECFKIDATTGDVSVKNIYSKFIDIELTTGKINASFVTCEGDIGLRLTTGDSSLENVSCKNFITKATTGDIVLSEVMAEEKIHIERSTGDVRFNGCDGEDIFVQVTTGDVNGVLLSPKIFIAHSSTGEVNVPKLNDGGKCEIKATTGDINISVDAPVPHE